MKGRSSWPPTHVQPCRAHCPENCVSARDVCAMVLDTFVRELQRSYRWRAKCALGLSSVDEAFTRMVTVIQRFHSALRLLTRSRTDPNGGMGA